MADHECFILVKNRTDTFWDLCPRNGRIITFGMLPFDWLIWRITIKIRFYWVRRLAMNCKLKKDSLNDCSLDLLIDLLIHWLIDWSLDLLSDLLIHWLIDWSLDLLIHWLIEWFTWLIDWLNGLMEWNERRTDSHALLFLFQGCFALNCAASFSATSSVSCGLGIYGRERIIGVSRLRVFGPLLRLTQGQKRSSRYWRRSCL